MKIILASASPRRSELLTRLGYPFTVQVSEADEHTEETDPRKKAIFLAKKKASAVFDSLSEEEKKEAVVIGADTLVALEDTILGKPADESEAVRMLQLLSGKTHQVYTGMAIVTRLQGMPVPYLFKFSEKTDVTFLQLSEKEIEDYVKTGEPLDKAGAYGIQGAAAKFISGISGDYYNVVGLPVSRLYRELRAVLKGRG